MTTLKLHSEPMLEQWTDAYGHLNEAYYLVPFSNANWALQAHFDIGVPYFDETGNAIYTVETHLRYLSDVRAPATFEIESMVLGVDQKRLHIGHVMWVDGIERATFECMTLHYSTRDDRTVPFPESIHETLRSAAVPVQPDWACRAVSFVKK